MSDENKEAETKVEKPDDASERIAKSIESLTKKHGSTEAALHQLLVEARDNRKEIADLKSDRDAIKSKIPTDGSVVLSGDEKDEYDAYLALGKPADLKKAKKDGEAAIERLAGIDLSEGLKKLGKEAGFVPEVFADLARMKGMKPEDMEVKEEKGKDGKPVKKVFVKGEGDSRTPIDKHAEDHWSAYMASLRGESKVEQPRQNSTPAPRSQNTAPPAPTGDNPNLTRNLAPI